MIFRRRSDLAHHEPKMVLVNFTATIVALFAVTGIWYLRAALEASFAGKGPAERHAHSVPEGIQILLDLRD
jgi:hypothetical protein